MVVHLGRTLPQRPSYSGPLGRARYTVERFLSGCLPENAAMLRRVWADNDQLAARRVPQDALPAVMILAAYAHAQEIALVDDYEALCERLEDALQLEGAAPHPDLYFASSCVILNKRGTVPSTESFESIKVPEIYEELLG